MSIEQFRYDNKRVLVIGGASGMGAATAKAAADLGAHTIVIDIADINFNVSQALKVDLSNKESVDAALTQIASPVDAIFSCAGVPDGVAPIMQINFISQRYIIDQLNSKDLINRGGAIAMISSAAGMAWMKNLTQILEFLSQSTWEAASEWVANHEGTNTYMFSKQAMCAFVANQCFRLLQKGIRINAILPGPTDTPLARANADTWLGFGTKFREDAGVEPLTTEQIANTMVYLCSKAADGINGQNISVDWGHINAAIGGAYQDPDLAALG